MPTPSNDRERGKKDASEGNEGVSHPTSSRAKLSLVSFAAVSAILNFVKTCPEDHLRPYYDSVVPSLKTILKECTVDYEILFGDACEALSLMATADPFKFQNDFHDISSSVMTHLSSLLPIHFHFSQVIQSTDRLCAVYKTDTSSLINSLMNTCIRAMNAPFVGKGTDLFELEMNSKTTAAQTIVKWLKNEEGYLPKESTSVVVSHAFEISELIMHNIRGSDTEEDVRLGPWNLSFLLNAMKSRGVDWMRNIWIPNWREIKCAVKTKGKKYLLEHIAGCVFALEKEGLSEEEVAEMGIMLREEMEEESNRRQILAAERNNAEAEGTLVLQYMSMIIRSLLVTRGPPTCQLISPLMPLIFVLLDQCHDKYWGLYLAKALILFAPDFSLVYRNQFVSLLSNALMCNDHYNVRYAASAFTQFIDVNNSEWRRFGVESLDAMCRLVSRPNARTTEEETKTTETAICAISTIVQQCDEKEIGKARKEKILVELLNWLPVPGLTTGTSEIYGFLVDLIEKQNQTIIGEPNTNSPRLLSILVKAIHGQILNNPLTSYSREVKLKVIEIIKKMSTDEMFLEWVDRTQLNEQERETLERILLSEIEDW